MAIRINIIIIDRDTITPQTPCSDPVTADAMMAALLSVWQVILAGLSGLSVRVEHPHQQLQADAEIVVCILRGRTRQLKYSERFVPADGDILPTGIGKFDTALDAHVEKSSPCRYGLAGRGRFLDLRQPKH